MRRIALAVLVAAAVTVFLPVAAIAQDTEPPATEGGKAVTDGPAVTDGKTEEGTAAPDQVAGERAEIVLREGTLLAGVVRSRQFEVQKGSRYVPTESPEDEGAGIRLYYALGLNGFLFVRQDAVQEIRFVGLLTAGEIQKISTDIEDGRTKAERDRSRAVADLAAKKAAAKAEKESAKGEEKEPGARSEGAAGGGAPLRLDAERLARVRDLLQRFPPGEWKPSRLDEIKKRMVILDIYPGEEERAFIDNFDLWEEGYRLWLESQGLPPEGVEPGTDKPASGTAPVEKPAPENPDVPKTTPEEGSAPDDTPPSGGGASGTRGPR